MTTSASDRSEGICAALARAEAAFDGRGWVEMPKADRNRYVTRAMLAKPLIAAAIIQAEREARRDALTRVRDAIDRSDSANDYPAWKSEALIVDMINALILVEKD